MSAPVVKVGEVADQIRGVTYSRGDARSDPGAGLVPVLRAGNISEAGLDFADLIYVPASRVSKKQFVRRNDVVIAASSGSLDVVGKAARATTDFAGGFGAFCKVLRPNSAVDAGYFAHFFRTQHYRRRVAALAAGANINNLKNEHLNDLVLPLPPLDEQRRIAATLDEADALRAKRREALAHLDDLTQSIFVDMFGDPASNPMGWSRVNLGEVVPVIDSGKSPNCEARPAGPDEWGVLKLGAVTYGVFEESQNKAYLGEHPDAASNEVRPGDLLFTRKNTGQLVGAAALVREVRPRLLIPDLIFRLQVDESRVLKPYLQTLLMNPRKRPEIRSLASGSAASRSSPRAWCVKPSPRDPVLTG